MDPEPGVVIAEFQLDHPILRHALSCAPEMRLTWERSDPVDEERIKFLFWAEGGDHDAFEAALADDPTVTTPRRTVEFGDRRLYQLDLVGKGRRTSLYPLLVEEGSIVHDLTATVEGWTHRATFTDFESFRRFREFCEQKGIPLTLLTVFNEAGDPARAAYGLTPPQRELLEAALETGYFEIPRATSLAELGTSVGISGNAASERLRRGMGTLVANTVGESA